AAVAGTGPRGRVTRADVEEYLAARQGRMPAAPRGLEPLPKRPLQPLPERSAVQRLPSPPERWAHPGHPPGPGGRLPAVQRRTPLAGRRGVIARRMTESAFSAPHVTLMTEAEIGRASCRKECRSGREPYRLEQKRAIKPHQITLCA